jgi:hypothetical protein
MERWRERALAESIDGKSAPRTIHLKEKPRAVVVVKLAGLSRRLSRHAKRLVSKF